MVGVGWWLWIGGCGLVGVGRCGRVVLWGRRNKVGYVCVCVCVCVCV